MKMSSEEISTVQIIKKNSSSQKSVEKIVYVEDNFDDPIYAKGKEYEIDDINSYKFNIDILGLECKICGSTDTSYKSYQKRSLDESETEQFECALCKMRSKTK